MSTPTIDLRRATTTSRLSAAEADSTLSSGGASNTIEQGQTQPSSLSHIRVFRGLAWLDDFVPLPQTPRGYLLFLLALTVICGLAVLQVWTSLRITQARAGLAAHSVQYSLIEQKNAELLWQIGQRTTLEQVQIRAVQLDFHPALQRNYITNAAVARSGLEGGAASQAEVVPVTASSAGATDSQAAAPRISSPALQAQRSSQAEADAAAAEEPALSSVPERFAAEEFEYLVSDWRQQVNESWQAGWQTVRQWGQPLLEQASDFILGQLKQP